MSNQNQNQNQKAEKPEVIDLDVEGVPCFGEGEYLSIRTDAGATIPMTIPPHLKTRNPTDRGKYRIHLVKVAEPKPLAEKVAGICGLKIHDGGCTECGSRESPLPHLGKHSPDGELWLHTKPQDSASVIWDPAHDMGQVATYLWPAMLGRRYRPILGLGSLEDAATTRATRFFRGMNDEYSVYVDPGNEAEGFCKAAVKAVESEDGDS